MQSILHRQDIGTLLCKEGMVCLAASSQLHRRVYLSIACNNRIYYTNLYDKSLFAVCGLLKMTSTPLKWVPINAITARNSRMATLCIFLTDFPQLGKSSWPKIGQLTAPCVAFALGIFFRDRKSWETPFARVSEESLPVYFA